MGLIKNTKKIINQNVYSHFPISNDLQKSYALIRARIAQDSPEHLINKRLKILDELASFPLGRFLIQNQGLNGYWMDYLTYRSNEFSIKTEVEDFIVNRSPLLIAIRERAKIFRTWLQDYLKDNITILSLPCGTMSDILKLDYSHISKIKLIGFDIDFESLNIAFELAEKHCLQNEIELIQADAMSLNWHDVANICVSHGFSFYLTKNQNIDLYTRLYNAIQPNGILITSFLTTKSEWNQFSIDDLFLEDEIFYQIINARWNMSYTEKEFFEIISQSGFKEIQTFHDKGNIMPTILAKKTK